MSAQPDSRLAATLAILAHVTPSECALCLYGTGEPREAARRRILRSYLDGMLLLQRHAEDFERPLGRFLESLELCMGGFPASLHNGDMEWAGCSATIILNCFRTARDGEGPNKGTRNLASFAYCALSSVTVRPALRTGNALLARAALLRGPAARLVAGFWQEPTASVLTLCSLADCHDATALWQQEGFRGTAPCFLNAASWLRDEFTGMNGTPDVLDRLLNAGVAAGRSIHAQLYSGQNEHFERGLFNVYNISDIMAMVSGWRP